MYVYVIYAFNCSDNAGYMLDVNSLHSKRNTARRIKVRGSFNDNNKIVRP